VIAEPTLEHYVYYLRHGEGESSSAAQKHRAAFEQDLVNLVVHLERLSGQAVSAWEWPEESQARIPSQFILRTDDWLENSETGRCCLISAGIYGDAYWLQAAYAQRGEVSPAIFASLRDEVWRPTPSDHLLGESVLLCGIVVQGEMVETDEMNDVEAAQRVLAAYLNDAPGAILATRLANGRAGLYGMREHPYLSALLYPDVECEDWAGEHITTNVTLRLELYRHKSDRQLTWCEQNLPLMVEQEQSLRKLLDEVNALSPVKASPENIRRLQELVRLYRVLSSNVGMLTDRQVTTSINLHNLGVVLTELEPLVEDRLLSGIRDRLQGRYEQLEADLTGADQPRQQAERIIEALKVEMALDRLLAPEPKGDIEGLIERGGFPGALPSLESEMIPPQIETLPAIPLTEREQALLQQVYLGYKRVQVEKEFSGGYGDSRVFLTLPITTRDRKAALTVTKLGLVHELRTERENYERYVEPHLPFCVAPLRGGRYYEQGVQAALNYAYVGEGTLGRAVDLETWYRQAASSRTTAPVVELLDDLLDKELGQHWYVQTARRDLSFAAEYGQHLVEHLRLRIRSRSSDGFWRVGQSPEPSDDYRPEAIEAIPADHEHIQSGEAPALLSVEGLVVLRVKRDQMKLMDPDGRGIFVRVEFAPESDAAWGLEAGDVVGVRGTVVYHRRERMEQIVQAAFPDLSPDVGSLRIEFPGVPGMYPNPLQVYPQILERQLKDRPHSYVHGDLHLRNVLVDERGRGWLIDFARAGERHNLFDFVKLETYVRLMGLGSNAGFSLNDYVRFEHVLAAATLEVPGKRLLHRGWSAIRHNLWRQMADRRLTAAYDMILATRCIAQKYIAPGSGFLNEYLPALFLYCLAVTKYYKDGTPHPTRLLFATASVLGRYLDMHSQSALDPTFQAT
jgi:hypothetical protein